MKTKSVPALVMLSAGFVTCIIGLCNKMDTVSFVKMLLLALVIFYVLGCIVKVILDKNFPVMGQETKEEENEVSDDVKENIDSDGESEKKKS